VRELASRQTPQHYNRTIRDRRKYGRGEKGGSVGVDTPPQRGALSAFGSRVS
jgi:hypothetical protein